MNRISIIQGKILNILITAIRDSYFRIVIGLLVAGAFLRFYRLFDFATFLGDQGRDALIVRAIATGEHFTAIGPPTSIGQVFLGPFYYYFIAPWLLLFNFHPGGLAFGVAFFASIGILLTYLATADMFGKKTGLITAGLLTFSSVLIDLSRFSWNPNLLPYFTFFSFYFLYKAYQPNAVRKRAWMYLFTSGALFSSSIQLHYLALGLALPMGIYMVYRLVQAIHEWRRRVVEFLFFALGSLLLISPLIFFDLRHGFINSKSFLMLLESGEVAPPPFVSSFVSVFSALNEFTFHIEMGKEVAWVMLIPLLLLYAVYLKKGQPIGLVMGTMFLSMVLLARFSQRLYPHYLGGLYVFYYVTIAWMIVRALEKKVKFQFIFIGILAGFIFINTHRYQFLTREPSKPINRAREVAQTISERVTSDRYVLTALPIPDFDSPYRYFLTLSGVPPIPRHSTEDAEELFVMCEKPCTPIGDAQWDVAYFAPTKIEDSWEADGIYMYKLTRESL